MSILLPPEGVTCFVDFGQNESQLAFRPTSTLFAELGILATWLPVQTALPGVGGKGETPYQARRRKAREANAARDLRRYAGRLVPALDGDPAHAAMALLWVQVSAGNGAEFAGPVLEGLWVRGEPVTSVVNDRLATMGLDAGFDDYAAGQGRLDMARLEAETQETGLYRGPAFIINGETFQGREHLPLIRWRLSGEVGTPPV